MNNEKNRDPITGRFITAYETRYDEMLIDHLSSGYSFKSFAGVIGVNADTLFEWVKSQPSFKEAKEIGTEKSLLFWERMGMAGTVGKVKNFNTASWIFNMKNRFGWRDRQEIKNIGANDEFISHDKIMDYIERKKF